MSRIACEVLGAGFDPADPDYRLFFKYALNPLTYPAITGNTFAQAFAVYRQIKQYRYDFNFDVTLSGGGGPINYAGGDFTYQQSVVSGDELELICNGFASVRVNDGGIDFAIGLCAYDIGSKLFSFGSGSIFATGLSLDPSLATGGGTALDFTFLGQSATVYADPSIVSAVGTFDISIASYWEYDNGLPPFPVGSPTDGPVFDGTTGGQIINPAPTGF